MHLIIATVHVNHVNSTLYWSIYMCYKIGSKQKLLLVTDYVQGGGVWGFVVVCTK